MGRLREVSGFALLLTGLVGCLLPVIPGIPMVMAGVALLGADHPRIRPAIRRLKQWSNLLARRGKATPGRDRAADDW